MNAHYNPNVHSAYTFRYTKAELRVLRLARLTPSAGRPRRKAARFTRARCGEAARAPKRKAEKAKTSQFASSSRTAATSKDILSRHCGKRSSFGLEAEMRHPTV